MKKKSPIFRGSNFLAMKKSPGPGGTLPYEMETSSDGVGGCGALSACHGALSEWPWKIPIIFSMGKHRKGTVFMDGFYGWFLCMVFMDKGL